MLVKVYGSTKDGKGGGVGGALHDCTQSQREREGQAGHAERAEDACGLLHWCKSVVFLAVGTTCRYCMSAIRAKV